MHARTHIHTHTRIILTHTIHTYTIRAQTHTHVTTQLLSYHIISFVCRLFSEGEDSRNWIVIHVNFTSIFPRTCDGASDYYQWTVSDMVSC